MKCVNEHCRNDPTRSGRSVVATIDGDLACCQLCLEEWEKQRDHFFEVILPDDSLYGKWLGGKYGSG